MPLVNTSKVRNADKRKYMCTRTYTHDVPTRVSIAQWEQDGMCSRCAEYLWDKMTSRLRNRLIV